MTLPISQMVALESQSSIMKLRPAEIRIAAFDHRQHVAEIGPKRLKEPAVDACGAHPEIGELPPALQVKLLRFLQDQTIERVGGREQLQVNVRIVAGTGTPSSVTRICAVPPRSLISMRAGRISRRGRRVVRRTVSADDTVCPPAVAVTSSGIVTPVGDPARIWNESGVPFEPLENAPTAPTLVPLVKIPLPSARSFAGRALATMRIAAGQLADSATPNTLPIAMSPV